MDCKEKAKRLLFDATCLPASSGALTGYYCVVVFRTSSGGLVLCYCPSYATLQNTQCRPKEWL
jgi:hypothetical protein